MKKLAVILLTAFISLFMLGAVRGTVMADAAADVCGGIGTVVDAIGVPDCAEPKGTGSVQKAISTAINLLSWVVGIAAVMVIIFGGFRYVTSGGDSNKVSSAKNAILFAVVGLIVVAMAQVIVRFTINKSSNNSSAPSNSTTIITTNPDGSVKTCANGVCTTRR
jgi:hypothetical protein